MRIVLDLGHQSPLIGRILANTVTSRRSIFRDVAGHFEE
jgi:hypothetical protein